MTSQPTFATLGERIVDFLKTALGGREPSRDSRTSDEILDDALSILPSDDEGWAEGLAAIASPVADWLNSHPANWKTASELLAVYFRSAHVPVSTPHPRAQPSVISTPRFGGVKKRPVLVELLVPVLSRLLQVANTEDRTRFLTTIDDWFVLSALEDVLPTLPLSPDEMTLFLRHFHEFAKADMARGSVEQAIKTWAGRYERTSMSIVDSAVGADELALPLPVIEVLVEGAVAQHRELMPWRDQVVERLAACSDEEAWKLAALLACFAWPTEDPPTIEQRHSALTKHIERMPARLLTTGLGAMIRDARSHPVPSMQTAIRLSRRWRAKLRTEDEQKELDARMIHAARSAMWGLEDSGADRSALLFVLPELLETPLQSYFPLDSFLADLVEAGAEARRDVRYFLARWLANYFVELREAQRSIHELFPLLKEKLGHDELVRWLVQSAVSTSQAEQAVAFLLLAKEDASFATPANLAHLQGLRAKAFAHLLVAYRAFGSFWVHWLFALALHDSAAETVAAEILETEAVPDYAGLCRRLSDSLSDERVAELRTRLLRRLDDRQAIHDVKVEIPEILALRPSAMRWSEALDRALREAQRKTMQSGRFPLLSLMQHVPIARGSGSLVGPQETPTQFKKYETRMDAPFVETVDPVASHVSRVEHLRRAQNYLEQAASE